MTPDVRPVSQMILSGNGYNVDTVMVDGEIIIRNKLFKNLDTKEIVEKANYATREMIKKIKIRTPCIRWTI